MSNIFLEVSIPLDEDGFIEMECDFCQNRFMLHKDVYESEENLNFFCPICGLPNRINTFFCPEILEAVQRKALNYMYSEIDRRLGKTIRDINRSGFVKMEMKIPHREAEKELYVPLENYETIHEVCCDIDVKVCLSNENVSKRAPKK